MSDDARIQAFRDALDMIADEASARNELAGRRAMESLASSQQELHGQAHATDHELRAANGGRHGTVNAGEWDAPGTPAPSYPGFDVDDFSTIDWFR